MIPKIIHYCWLSSDPIPYDLSIYMKTWKQILSDYEFILWNFDRFDKDSSRWVLEAFNNKKYAFAADYIRLFAIYNYGGIYMDMDIEVLRSFDKLLMNDHMFAYERPDRSGIEAGCFGAEKGNIFIKNCLDYYKDRNFVKSDGTFDLTPLPIIMKQTLENGNFSMNIYSHDYFTTKSFDTGLISTTENTYCIHHFAGSWKTEKEQKVIQLTNKLSKKIGFRIAYNLAEYKIEIEEGGLASFVELTKKKIYSKMRKKSEKKF